MCRASAIFSITVGMLTRLFLGEVLGVDRWDQRAIALSGLLGGGIGSLALLQEVVERCVRSETHAEEKERVWVLAVVGRHRDSGPGEYLRRGLIIE